MRVFKDASGNRVTFADLGATWLSDERIAELGLTEVDSDYEKPVSTDELLAQNIAEIEAKYQKKFDAYDQRILAIFKAGGDEQATKLAEVQAEYTAELAKKDAEILEIMGGVE